LPKVTPTTSARSKSCSTCRKEWKKWTFLTRNNDWHKKVICVGCWFYLQLENKWIQTKMCTLNIAVSFYLLEKIFANKTLFKSLTYANNCLRNIISMYSAMRYST
jgi:hypothetical protein